MTVTVPRSVAERVGPAWAARLSRPGVLLLPLRGFLGITFCFAGLQKLANPAYLDPHSPTSVVAQMRGLAAHSPIGGLLSASLHAPTLVGLLIAVGELAVGVGALLGLLTRVAAAGGMLLALTFFLTVSWNTTPYYYGSDIVFVFAWSVLLLFGSAGVLSLDTFLRNRARQAVGRPPEPIQVPIPTTRLRELCARGGKCGLGRDGLCARPRGCPIFAPDERPTLRESAALDRRTVLASAAGIAGAGIATAALAGVTAATGRALHNDTTAGAPAAPRGPVAPPAKSPSPTPSTSSAPGTAIAKVTAIPVGQAKSFTDPATQSPAWLVHTGQASFVAFSAICTHAGCAVSYDPSNTVFICPCHGGVYDARTGKVLQGPPPAPLQAIGVQVADGEVRVR
jgi:thiosulfate dehydrogenase [quinone] large subunit